MKSRVEERRGACRKHQLQAAALLALLWILQPVPVFTDVEMTGFSIIQETQSGQWEIRAGKAYYDDGGDVILEEVSARMVSGGVERVKVASERGRYESDGLLLYLEGDVSVASAWGSRFHSTTLKWDGPSAVMTATGGVSLLRQGWTIRGESVRYTVNAGTAKVEGGVRTTWNERSEQR